MINSLVKLSRRVVRLFVVFSTLVSPVAWAGVDWVINNSDTGYDPISAGGDIVYVVTVGNNGSSPAPATTLTLSIPATTTFVGASGMTCSGTGPVACDVPILSTAGNAGDSATVNVTIHTSAQGTVTLGASVPTTGDDDVDNNTDNEPTTVNAGSDIALVLSGLASAQSGNTVSYTFTATNNGPDASGNQTLSFPVPAGLVNVTPPGSCSLSGSTYTCPVAGLAVGASSLLTFSGQISAGSPSTLTPSGSIAQATGPLDPITANNTATFNTTVTTGSDLRIAKSRAPAGTLLVGQSVSFTLTPTYTGDSPSGLTITDTLPANYTVGAVASPQNGWGCSVAGQTVTCTKSTGSSAGSNVALGNIVIPATVASAGSGVTNTASISATGPSDPNPANNSANDGGATIQAPTVDLRANKSGPSPALVVTGLPFNWNISASNLGNAAFHGTLTLTDNLPANVTINSYTLNGWSCSPAAPVTGPAVIACTRSDYTSLAPLAASASTPVITLNATASAAGALTNSMTASSPNPNIPDTNPANDTVTHTVTASVPGDAADLAVTKTAAPDPVAVGDVLTYTITVSNFGPTTAANVTLTDSLTSLINSNAGPTGAGFIDVTAPPGASCSHVALGTTSRNLTCTIATLANGASAAFAVQVRPGGNGGNRVNTATVISNTTADPNLANNSGSVTSTVDPPRADVTVSKTASPASVPAGQNLTYVVTATNIANGLSAASAVTITDTLPSDVTFISAVPSAGLCGTAPAANSTTGAGNNQIVCNFGTLANGAQQTVTIVVRPNSVTRGTTLANNVTVSTTTTEANLSGTDPSLNNSASASTPVQNPVLDLLINKVDSVDPVAVGDNTVYTVSVTNQGPSAAENVVLTDTLPTSRFSYQSHTAPSGGSCSTTATVGNAGGTVTCNLPYLAAGQARSFTVTLQGIAKGVDTNSVAVSSMEVVAGFDSNAANNAVNETTTVRTKADVQVVSKIASASPVNLRDNFNFVVKVRNNVGAGLAEADNVVVSDTLPAGMQLAATPTVAIVAGSATTTTCTGTAGSTSFACNLGTLSSGGEVDITVPVEVVAASANPQTFTNAAAVATSSLDTVPANNSNSGSVTVNSSSLAGRVFRDFNNDGLVSAGDTGITGVTMTLSGTSFDGAPITRIATTDANGNYSFVYLPQGTYTLSEGAIGEVPLIDGIDTAGSAGGNTSVNDTISAIALPANTVTTGYNFAEVPVPRVGLAKSAGGVVNHGDGTYSVVFTLLVRNAGTTPLAGVQITDALAGALPQFGTYTASVVPAAGEYTIASGPTVSAQANGAALTAVAAGIYTGSGAGTALLVSATSSLPNTGASASSAQVGFTVRFFPTTQGPFENSATAAGTSPVGANVTDNSVDGANPDANNNGDPTDDASPTVVNLSAQAIGVAKRVAGIVQTGAKRYRIPYTLIVENVSTAVTATNVQVSDNLSATFPTAQTIAIATTPAVSACTGTVLAANATFNGTSQPNLLAGNQNLQPGERCTITFTTEIDFGSNPLPTAVQNNQAVATTAQTPGGTVIATDLSDDGNVPDANGNHNADESGENDPTPVSFAAGNLSSVSGTVYLDANHNRSNDDPLASSRVQGFIVEVLNATGTVVGTATTDANGNYTVGGLFPSTAGDASTYYAVRFREPASGAIYGIPQSSDPTPARNGTISNGVITGLPLVAGVTTLEQNLPLDPSGVIYDSITRAPVAGAQVTLTFGGVPVLDGCLVDGMNTQTTGGTGQYQFLLINPTPPGCPGSGTYTIQVVQPAGYLAPPSAILPPAAGSYTPTNGGVDAIQAQSGPPSGAAPTTYYFSFVLTLGASSQVVNNHIPLDPILGGAIAVTKTTPLVNVARGDLVPYTITATNTLAATLPNIDIVDRIPPGFRYRSGSATLNAVPSEPTFNGRQFTWRNQTFTPGERKVFKLILTVGAGVSEGEYPNLAWAMNNVAAAQVSNTANATVRVIPDPTFDCSDIIGKVFDDKNANGWQDEGEPGIPNVRVVTARGLLVTTDTEGRFHVACAAIPQQDHGANFVMKLDERTLPTGYRVTTENPRDVRVTRGKMVKLNFGATVHRVVRLELSGAAFVGATLELAPDWADQLAALPEKLKERPSVLRIAYRSGSEAPELGRRRVDALAGKIRSIWKERRKDDERLYPLVIETELEGAK